VIEFTQTLLFPSTQRYGITVTSSKIGRGGKKETKMGLVTHFVWRYGARCISVLLASPEFARESERQLQHTSGNLALSEVEQRTQQNFVSGLYYVSFAADILDYLNTLLDIIFAAFLLRLSDSTVYAVVLLTGIVLGRVAIVRGTYLLFKHGITWSPFWMSDYHDNRAMQLFHTLFFTESAVFLFEDYPCLVIYGHWGTINFPPVCIILVPVANSFSACEGLMFCHFALDI
jgi:hypothetical protein